MELIKNWLAGNRNYYIGAALYKQFGKDDKLKKYFSGAPDAIKKKQLDKELQAMMDKPAIKLAPEKNTETDEMPEGGDAILIALREEWLKSYQRMKYLQYELDRYTGNTPEDIAKRKPIAFEILELEQECMTSWARRDHYLQHGQLPEVKPDDEPLPTDPILLGRLIENTKKNIRRNKRMMIDNPDIPKYALLVQEYEAKLARILKLMTNE